MVLPNTDHCSSHNYVFLNVILAEFVFLLFVCVLMNVAKEMVFIRGGLSFSSFGVRKTCLGCALFSNVELDTGMIQKTIIASFATCCCTSYRCSCINYLWTYTYLSEYLYKYSEGGRG